MRVVSLWSACQGGSTDMHINLLRSALDLKAAWPKVNWGQNLALTLRGSTNTSFDAPGWQKYDGAQIEPLTSFVQKLFKNYSEVIDDKPGIPMLILGRYSDLRGQQLLKVLKLDAIGSVSSRTTCPFSRSFSSIRSQMAGSPTDPTLTPHALETGKSCARARVNIMQNSPWTLELRQLLT